MKVQPVYEADKGSGSEGWPEVLKVEIFRMVLEEDGVVKQTSYLYSIPNYPIDVSGATCFLAHPPYFKKLETEEDLSGELSKALKKYRKKTGIEDAKFEFINPGRIRFSAINRAQNLSEEESRRIQKGLEEKLDS